MVSCLARGQSVRVTLTELIRTNLRRIRQDRDWTQQEMSERTGLHQSTISQRETGAKGWEELLTLEEALRRAGIDSLELVRQPGEVDPEALEMARLLAAADEPVRNVIRTLLHSEAQRKAAASGGNVRKARPD